MNERIKQLAAEVGISVEYLNNTKQWELIEALAELIVKECIDVVSDCSVEYCTRPQIASEIKEHFGVEE